VLESPQALYKICRVYIKEDIFYSDQGPILKGKCQKWPPKINIFPPATALCCLTCPELLLYKWQYQPPFSSPHATFLLLSGSALEKGPPWMHSFPSSLLGLAVSMAELPSAYPMAPRQPPCS
jgi:hypothetical protein